MNEIVHPIDFGKVTYEPGAPKNAPRWVWRCGCVKCRELPFPEGLRGPFKTRRAAERDVEQFLSLYHCERGDDAQH
jgi:hypothetical protein